jgi:hypothetical protein
MNAPNVLRHPKMRIADVQCSRLKFEPGDRLLVHVNYPLTKNEERKLRRSIGRWAGEEVVILIVDRTKMTVEVDKNRGGIICG